MVENTCGICSKEEGFFVDKVVHGSIDYIYYGKNLSIIDKVFRRDKYPKFDRIMNCICLECLGHLLQLYKSPPKLPWTTALEKLRTLLSKIKDNDSLEEINRLLQEFGYKDQAYELQNVKYISDTGLEKVIDQYREIVLDADELDGLEADDLESDVCDINAEIEKRNLDIQLISYRCWN